MSFEPDYRHIAAVMANDRPGRLPLYEHTISAGVMGKITGRDFAALQRGSSADLDEFFRCYCGFFKEMTYDAVSYEVCMGPLLPGHGALSGGMAGPIQSREDFESYPWDELPGLYERHAAPRFDALVKALPAGMKIVGGVGNGVFERSEELVGLEYLPFLQIDDPELYADLFVRIGDLMVANWAWFLERYSDHMVACRFGDDLGFKASLLTNPSTIREHIFPQYKRTIDLIHSHGKPFLLHSCGCIFEVMEDAIALGIDAKHSNEDVIAPFDRWIDSYGDRIGLVGGFDMDFLCSEDEGSVYDAVVEQGSRFRAAACGYALGSGNSIPDYVPVENYLAMVRGAQTIREREAG